MLKCPLQPPRCDHHMLPGDKSTSPQTWPLPFQKSSGFVYGFVFHLAPGHAAAN